MVLCAMICAGTVAWAAEPLGYSGGLVRSEEGTPVVDALVVALPVLGEGADESVLEEEGYVGSDVTNAAGAFEIVVIPGTYVIVVEAEGYVPVSVEVEICEGIAFADSITIIREATISGVVYEANGTTPASEVIVVATALDGDLLLAQSDDEGLYTIVGLPAGEYTLSAFSDHNQYLDAGPVIVASGDTIQGMDFAAVVPEPQAEPHSDNGGVAGFVRLAEGGDAVAGATLLLTDEFGEFGELDIAPSGEDGGFFVEGLASGSYQVAAFVEGHAVVFVEGVVVEAGVVTSGIEILVLPGIGEIRGTVTAAGGSPIAGALVMTLATNWSQAAFSDEDGTFILTDLPEGTADVVAVADGFAMATIEGVVVQSGARADVNLILGVANDES